MSKNILSKVLIIACFLSFSGQVNAGNTVVTRPADSYTLQFGGDTVLISTDDDSIHRVTILKADGSAVSVNQKVLYSPGLDIQSSDLAAITALANQVTLDEAANEEDAPAVENTLPNTINSPTTTVNVRTQALAVPQFTAPRWLGVRGW